MGFKDWWAKQTPSAPTPPATRMVRDDEPPPSEYKPPKEDISEPVITLLEMLGRDEWEVVHCYENQKYVWTTTNTLNRDIVIVIRQSAFSGSYVEDFDWMTDDEKTAVIKAVGSVNKRAKAIANKIQREQFAIKLGAQNGLV